MTSTDDWSGVPVLQALANLNQEIVQCVPAVAKDRDRETKREHAQDATLVLFALHAWVVWGVTRVTARVLLFARDVWDTRDSPVGELSVPHVFGTTQKFVILRILLPSRTSTDPAAQSYLGRSVLEY
ncbi:hypothetical protein BD310DRAFT_980573 [Dichomitus squalens]|uniref:Uncharacterized protein n=1 Tax=Dichomitus squalens TaxID=114155 RepID=A0A4Q9PJ64_9APHY|nr:hypothetical protein BD310DRAFT_980573 [Dichomitus squalens]